MIKHNNDIRTKARENGVYLYEIAEKLNVSEPTFNRWLRKEMSEDLKQKALAAIEQIREEHEAEQRSEESPLQSWKKNFLFSSAVIQAFANTFEWAVSASCKLQWRLRQWRGVSGEFSSDADLFCWQNR